MSDLLSLNPRLVEWSAVRLRAIARTVAEARLLPLDVDVVVSGTVWPEWLV